MCVTCRFKAGVATLWSLFVLFSALLLLLMSDDALIALQRADVGERLRYVQQREALLKQSLAANLDAVCQQAAVNQSIELNSFQYEFSLNAKTEQIHWISCHQQQLSAGDLPIWRYQGGSWHDFNPL